MPLKKFFIVGGGIIGLNIAREIALSVNDAEVHVIERQTEDVSLPSYINSGVVHSGIYYRTGSLRAQLSVQGNKLLQSLALDLGIPVRNTGKIIVAHKSRESEIKSLAVQAKRNGVEFQRVSGNELNSLQPGIPMHSTGLHVTSTSMIEPPKLMSGIREILIDHGVVFHTGMVENLDSSEIHNITGQHVKTSDVIFNAAGPDSLRLARLSGIAEQYSLVSVLGRYLMTNEPSLDIRMPIYGMPLKNNIALGAHITPREFGGFSIGPSAELKLGALSMGQETSHRTRIKLNLLRDRTVQGILKESILNSQSRTLKNAARLLEPIQDLDIQDFYWGNAASRPQIFNHSLRRLEDDFMVLRRGQTVHLLNIISPGWTSSIGLAKHAVSMIAV